MNPADCQTNATMVVSAHPQGPFGQPHAAQNGPGIWGGLCFLVAIGAGIYFVRHAHGFGGVVWSIVKAIFWPVVVGYAMMARLAPASPAPKACAALRAASPRGKSK